MTKPPSGELIDPTNSDDKAYFLSVNNVSPTKDATTEGRDEDAKGTVPEETICSYSEKIDMMDLAGNLSEVPISNGRVPSLRLEAQIYRVGLVRELIAAGHLPIDVCPYASATPYKPSGPLVRKPDGAKACAGEPGGCVHFLEVKKKRHTRAMAIWESSNADRESISIKNLDRLANYFGSAPSAEAAKAELVKRS